MVMAAWSTHSKEYHKVAPIDWLELARTWGYGWNYFVTDCGLEFYGRMGTISEAEKARKVPCKKCYPPVRPQ